MLGLRTLGLAALVVSAQAFGLSSGSGLQARRRVAEAAAVTPLMYVKVNVGDNEPIESAMRRFKKEVMKSGHLMELRHRRHFENNQEKVKRKSKEARRRNKMIRVRAKQSSPFADRPKREPAPPRGGAN